VVLMSKFSPKYYADKILKGHSFLSDKQRRFWRYDKAEGIWRERAEDYLSHYLRKNILGEESLKVFYIKEIIAHIRDINYSENDFPEADKNLIFLVIVFMTLKKRKWWSMPRNITPLQN